MKKFPSLVLILAICTFFSCDFNNENQSKDSGKKNAVVEPVSHITVSENATDKEINAAISKSTVKKGIDTPDTERHGIINGNKEVILTVQTGNGKKDGCDDPGSCFFIAYYTYKDPEGVERTYSVMYKLNEAGQNDLERGRKDVFIYNYNPNDHADFKVVSERLDAAYVYNTSNDKWLCYYVESREYNILDECRYNLFFFNISIQNGSTSSVLSATNTGTDTDFMYLDGWFKYLADNNLSDSNYFTLAVLPDTQYLSKGTYYKQAESIVTNAEYMNTKFVLHLGDMTDESLDEEWLNADNAHKVLEYFSMPYCVTKGNHDNCEDFNRYFGYSRFLPYLGSWYGGVYTDNGENHNDNGSFYFFESNNVKFLVISLAGASTEDKLHMFPAKLIDWANKKIGEYKDRKVIVVTHCYIGDGLSHYEIDKGTDKGKNLGKDLWDNIISKNENIFMVVNGHTKGGDGYRIRPRSGNMGPVLEVIIDYSWEDEGRLGGWYKVFTFFPDADDNKILMYPINVEKNSIFYRDGRYAGGHVHLEEETDSEGRHRTAADTSVKAHTFFINDFDLSMYEKSTEDVQNTANDNNANDNNNTGGGCGSQASAAEYRGTPAGYLSELLGLLFIMLIPLSLIACGKLIRRRFN